MGAAAQPVRPAVPAPVAFIVRVLVVAAALGVATWWLDGVRLEATTTAGKAGTLIAVALIFGIVNAVLKPVLLVLSCPLVILTLGLFALVVNGLLFWLVGTIGEAIGLPFVVDGFWAGFWGAIIVAIVSWLLYLIIPDALDRR